MREVGNHTEGFDWTNRIRAPAEFGRPDWTIGGAAAPSSSWLDGSTERARQDPITSNCVNAQLDSGSSVSAPLMIRWSQCRQECLFSNQRDASLQRTHSRLFLTPNHISAQTRRTVFSDLISTQVYVVEADVALNFDPHSHNTTNSVPTYRPILLFLILTMAGGCGVSNLM